MPISLSIEVDNIFGNRALEHPKPSFRVERQAPHSYKSIAVGFIGEGT